MSLFTGLLTLPLAPVRGVMLVAEVLEQEAARELAAAGSPQRALAELEAAHASGELSDEDFALMQDELIDAVVAAHGDRGVG
jgi:DNA-binding GntR family transcriptional regulator